MEKVKSFIRSCEVCGFQKGEVLHTQKFVTRDGVPKLNEYDVVECEKCGFVFADTPVSQEKYNFYYADFSKYEDEETASGGNVKPFDINRFQSIVGKIEKITSNKQVKILDIGCANGGLLDAFLKKGYSNLCGVDPSPKCVETVKRQGIACELGNVFNLDNILDCESFDVVILSHVLEHIKDLKHAATMISALIKKDGILYVEVPDSEMYKKYYHGPFYYFDYEHINHFNRSSLANLFSIFSVMSTHHEEMLIEGGIKYPALGICLKKSNTTKEKILPSFNLKEKIKEFVEYSNANNKINDLIKPLIENKMSVVIWGAGQYTQRLLATSNLSCCNISHLIDKDSNKVGGEIGSYKIKDVQSLIEFNGVILIASALYSGEIVRDIKGMNISNDVIVLS